MKVEMWSDFMCPFCYIGNFRLQKAIEAFKHDVEVEFRTFQLFPGLRTEPGKNLFETLAAYKGSSVAEMEKVHEGLAETGAKEGLEFNFSRVVPTDTLDALRLVHFAKDHGLENEFMNAVFQGYFTDSLDIGDHMTLIQLADSVGLDPVAAEKVLTSDAYMDKIEQDRQIGSEIGVKGVPFFVIDNRYAISGAHDPEIFLEVLQKAHLEDIEDEGEGCGSDCTCGRHG